MILVQLTPVLYWSLQIFRLFGSWEILDWISVCSRRLLHDSSYTKTKYKNIIVKENAYFLFWPAGHNLRLANVKNFKFGIAIIIVVKKCLHIYKHTLTVFILAVGQNQKFY